MNNKKSFIIGIGIVLLVGIFSLVIVIFSNNKKPDVSIDKDESVIVVKNDNNEISEKGWTKIRTQKGKVGYVKTNKLEEIVTTREAKERKKQIDGKVDMFWDYYSQYVKAPDRTGQVIEGVNVVSPSFFYLDKDTGELKDNVGDAGVAYINWAHSNGYKVWPLLSNSEAGIKVSSTILNTSQ